MDKIVELPYCAALAPLPEQLKLVICFGGRDVVVENLRRFAFEECLGREIQNVAKATDTEVLCQIVDLGAHGSGVESFQQMPHCLIARVGVVGREVSKPTFNAEVFDNPNEIPSLILAAVISRNSVKPQQSVLWMASLVNEVAECAKNS
jgi:hypothetical protein